jgi:hypothetical protein
MAQVTLYLPEELAAELRRGAKRARKSLSAYVAELAAGRTRPRAWPPELLATFGSWRGAFPVPEELPVEDRDPW